MTHITEIETMASQLQDVEAPVSEIQIMTKIICTLPPSYRSFTTAWDSVPAAEKTIALLTSRLLKEETMAKRWSKGQPDANDTAFFAHNFPSHNRPNNSNSTPTFRGRGFKRGGRSNNRHQPYTAKVCTSIDATTPRDTPSRCVVRNNETKPMQEDLKKKKTLLQQWRLSPPKRKRRQKHLTQIMPICHLRVSSVVA